MASIGIDQGRSSDRTRRRPTRRLLAVGLATLVLAGAAVAASDGGSSSRSGGPPIPGSGGAVGRTAGGDDGRGAAEVPSGSDQADGRVADVPARVAQSPDVGAAPAEVGGGEPRIVKRAELAIEVDGSVTEAFDRVIDVARSQGGFVVSSSTSSAEQGPGRADLTLRVPAEHFDATRAALAGVGDLRSVRVEGDDVTAQLVDLEARLRALRAEEDALNGLLGEAGNVGEVLAVRQQVSATRLEIEQLAAQQASLDDRATYSTLQVTLSQPGAGVFPPGPESVTGLARSWERALAGAVAVVGGMVVVVGYAGPFLVLGLLVWAGQRVARPRRRPA